MDEPRLRGFHADSYNTRAASHSKQTTSGNPTAWLVLILTTGPLALIMYITYERGGASAIRREVEQSLEATSKPARWRSKTTLWAQTQRLGSVKNT